MECLVSIIIAVYNAEKHICDSIDSILNQTWSNWELIICDDASTDQTWKIISDYGKEDKRIHILRNSKNMYAAYSRNKCIDASHGKYIMIQDADDLSDKNRIRILVETIERESVDFVSTGHYLFDDNGIYKTKIPVTQYPTKKDFLYGIPFCHASTLFKTDCIKSVDGYRVSDETRRGQDYDLFMRLYACGFKGINIKDCLYSYRVDRETIKRRKFKYRIDECIIRYKGFKSLSLLPKYILYVFKPIPAYFLQLLRSI